MQLKIQNNDLKSENIRLRTQVNQLEKEFSKRIVQFEEKASENRAGMPTPHLVLSLKQAVKELKASAKLKEEEVKELKRDIKSTKVEELQAEIETYQEECKRLLSHIQHQDIGAPARPHSSDRLQEENEIMREDIEQLTSALKGVQDENISLRDTITILEKRTKAKKSKESPSLAAEIQKLKQLVQSVQSEKQRTEATLATKDAQIEILSQEKAKIGSELSLAKATESEFEQRIEGLVDDKRKLVEEKKELMEEIRVMREEKLLESERRAAEGRNSAAVELEVARGRTEALEGQIAALNKEIAALMTQTANDQTEIKTLVEEIERGKREVLRLEGEVRTGKEDKERIASAFETAKSEHVASLADITRIHSEELEALRQQRDAETRHFRERLEGESTAFREALATAAEKEQVNVKLMGNAEKHKEEIRKLKEVCGELEERRNEVEKELMQTLMQKEKLEESLERKSQEGDQIRESILALLHKPLKKMSKKAQKALSQLSPDESGQVSTESVISACLASGVSLKPAQIRGLSCLYGDGRTLVSLPALLRGIHPDSDRSESSSRKASERLSPRPPTSDKPEHLGRESRFHLQEEKPGTPECDQSGRNATAAPPFPPEASRSSEEIPPIALSEHQSDPQSVPVAILDPAVVVGSVETESRPSLNAPHPPDIIYTDRGSNGEVDRPGGPEPLDSDSEGELSLDQQLETVFRHISLRYQINRIAAEDVLGQLVGMDLKAEAEFTVRFIKRQLAKKPPEVLDLKEQQMVALFLVGREVTEGGLREFLDDQKIPISVLKSRLSSALGDWDIFSESQEQAIDSLISQELAPKAAEFQSLCEQFDSRGSGYITETQFNSILSQLQIEFPQPHRHYLSLLFYSQDQRLDSVPYTSLLTAYVQQDDEEMDDSRTEVLEQYLKQIANALISSNRTLRDVLPYDVRGLSRPRDLRAALQSLSLSSIPQAAFELLLEALQFQDEVETCIHIKDFEAVLTDYGVAVSEHPLANSSQLEKTSSKNSQQDVNEYETNRLEYSVESLEKMKSQTLSDASPFRTTEGLRFSGQRSSGSPRKDPTKTPVLIEEPPLMESSGSSDQLRM